MQIAKQKHQRLLRIAYYTATIGLAFAFSLGTSAGVIGGQDPGETIEIIAAHLEGRLDAYPSSGYNRLLAKVLPTQSHYLKYQRYPLSRAIRKFDETKRVCLFPTSLSAIEAITSIKATELIEGNAIDIVSSHFFSESDQQIFSTIKSLEGTDIAVQQGIAETAIFNLEADFNMVKTPDDLSALKILLAGRVDAMYGWLPDTLLIAERHNLPLPIFDADFVSFQTTTHFVCKNFGGAQNLIKVLNMRLDALKQTGELQKILGPHAQVAN